MVLFKDLVGSVWTRRSKTVLAGTIEINNDNIAYDNSIKAVLANEQVLARVLKYSVEEFEDCDIDDIISWMDEPVISGVNVEPGMTNKRRRMLERITLLQQEDYVSDEGLIRYDIRFNIVHKERKIKFLMNLEAQKSTSYSKLKYHIDNRIIFYIARMISAQKGTEFINSDYDDIKPVRTIWICMDAKADEDSIIRIKYAPEIVYGKPMELPNIDKAQGIIIRIRTRENVEKSKNILIAMLEEVIRKEPADKKNQHLAEEYDFKMEEEFEGRIRTMCNWSEAISERWYEDGVRSVIENALKNGKTPEEISQGTTIDLGEIIKIQEEMLVGTK